MAFKQQPLNQEEYSMKIIEDLGNIIVGNATRTNRYAICECTLCHKHFQVRMGSSAAKAQVSCVTCTLNESQHYTHPLYAIWNGIKQRCYNPKRKDYYKYGGKGVTMCDTWLYSSRAFYKFCIENGWTPDCVIDKDIKCREQGISPQIYSPTTISFVTQSTNCREASGKTIEQYSLEGNLLKVWDSAIEAGLAIGHKSGDSITSVCKGRAKTAGGYIWKYVNSH